MARRRAIEPDELFETANRVDSEGREVTATVLLDELGGGSLRTIYKLLEVWRQNRPAVTVSVSDEIPPSVQIAFANAWRLATQEAGRAITAAREKASEEIATAQKQFQEALENIERLEKESEADEQEIDDLKAKLAQLEDSLRQAQTDASAQKATADQLREQVKSQEAELERRHTEISKERAEHQQEITRLNALSEAAQEKTTKELDTLRFERDEALREAAELRGQNEALKAQNTELMSLLGRS